VKREPGGVFSRWLFSGGEGSFLRISEPAGNYYLPEEHRNDVVCFAGGIGITPALAMVRSVLARSRDLRCTSITLLATTPRPSANRSY
jgi:nitric-oxide synthase